MKPELCNASPYGIGHAGEYGKIGFSPCRAYVAHESNKLCDVINNLQEDFTQECNCVVPGSNEVSRSGCASTLCPCGEFLSHRVFDPCTAKISEPEALPELKKSIDISVATNIFSEKEIDGLYEIINAREPEINTELGRIQFDLELDSINTKTVAKLNDVIKEVTDLPLAIHSVTYVEYNSLYGKPNLPPHVDGDTNDLILNIQLESNTDWDIGLNLQTYQIEDNSALIFNPNKEIHWRVYKDFKDGEYVRMLFIRLFNPDSPSDYSYLPHRQDDEMFKHVRAFRDGYPHPDKPKMS
jgi:hypothetical protein